MGESEGVGVGVEDGSGEGVGVTVGGTAVGDISGVGGMGDDMAVGERSVGTVGCGVIGTGSHPHTAHNKSNSHKQTIAFLIFLAQTYVYPTQL